MAKKTQNSLLSTLILAIAAALVAVIAYKQIYLVGKVTTALPEAALTASLQRCFQEHLTPTMLQSGARTDLGMDLDLGRLMGGVLGQLSSGLVETRVTKNYLGEIKVLRIQDLLATHAEMRVNGSLDLLSRVPLMGEIPLRRDYQVTLMKRDDQFHFDGIAIKATDSAQWDRWDCAQRL